MRTIATRDTRRRTTYLRFSCSTITLIVVTSTHWRAHCKRTDAIKFYGLALGYDIDDTSVIVPMAECFARSGDRATALECLDALLALHAQTPQDPALVSRAEALRSLLNADRQGERT